MVVANGLTKIGCEVRNIGTRKVGTRTDPIDDIESVLGAAVSDYKPDVLLWMMCKTDCPPGVVAYLRALQPGLRTVYHSFDDPMIISDNGSPQAFEFEYAITCCVGSIPWYAEHDIDAICLYPPVSAEIHGRAQPVAELQCDISFAATNVYPKHKYPETLVLRTELARAAAQLGRLRLYGPWDGTSVRWGGHYGDQSLQPHWHGQKSWDEMPAVYASSRINLNSHNRPDGYQYLNERALAAPASGGFMLVDRVAGLEELFEPGVHLDTYASVEEAADKARYWLSHEAERLRVVEAGRKYVLERFDDVTHARRLMGHVGLA
jgi:glycosyltransferase involved in cell wall biosynthesis